MSDHTEIEELLALEALGGLEPDDRARLDALLAEHGADDPEYEELRSGFADTAAMLGTGLRPTEVSAGLEDRTVAAALAGGQAAIAPTHRRRNALIAIAAAVVLVAVGALGGYLAAPRSAEQTFLSQPGVRVVPFEPSDGTGGAMTLAVGPDGTHGLRDRVRPRRASGRPDVRALDDQGRHADVPRLRGAFGRPSDPAGQRRVHDRGRGGRHGRVDSVSLGPDDVAGDGRQPLTRRTTRFRLALPKPSGQDARGFGLARTRWRHGAGTCRRRYVGRW